MSGGLHMGGQRVGMKKKEGREKREERREEGWVIKWQCGGEKRREGGWVLAYQPRGLGRRRRRGPSKCACNDSGLVSTLFETLCTYDS